MLDRSELPTKLSAASDWVRDEFAYITGVAADLGLALRVEGGPGMALLLDERTVARVHPKLRHIGIGLPDALRDDVAALTSALRAQQGFAWFNYTPDAADRDTVELLLTVSRDLAETYAAAGRSATKTPAVTQSDTAASPRTHRRLRDDNADLSLILNVVKAFQAHAEATRRPSSIKPLREVIFFQWEGPRLPPGGTRSAQLPHSPAARAQRATGDHSGLVYEHVRPLSTVIRQLLDHAPEDVDSLRAILDATADRVVITKVEDAALTAAGLRDTTPNSNDPWSRYRTLGLEKIDFTPLA